MTRAYNAADDSDWDWGRQALWDQAVKRATESKRGQAALREIRDALEAMPVRELVAERFVTKTQCCTLGAVYVHRLVKEQDMDWSRAVATLAEDLYGGAHCDECGEVWPACDCESFYLADDVDAIGMGQALNMAYALAWTIVWETDEVVVPTRAALWERMHAWVIERISEG